MVRRSVLIMLCLFLSASTSVAEDDVMEKIRLLEQQIQELKLLKQQQAVTAVKFDHCMKAFARKQFCSCVSESLPLEVSFGEYVHILISSGDQLGYQAMTVAQKKIVDATLEVREKCIEKGFFR